MRSLDEVRDAIEVQCMTIDQSQQFDRDETDWKALATELSDLVKDWFVMAEGTRL